MTTFSIILTILTNLLGSINTAILPKKLTKQHAIPKEPQPSHRNRCAQQQTNKERDMDRNITIIME